MIIVHKVHEILFILLYPEPLKISNFLLILVHFYTLSAF